MTHSADFTRLCQSWWDVVCRAAFHVLQCDDDAQDAAQRVFMRLWKSGGWRHIQRPASFFAEAGRREALSILRRRPPSFTSSEAAFALQSRPIDPGMASAAAHADRLRDALRVIERLPPRCRLAFTLVVFEGMTHVEVARHLGISVKAVEKQVARARRHLLSLNEDGEVSSFLDGGGVGSPCRLYEWKVSLRGGNHWGLNL